MISSANSLDKRVHLINHSRLTYSINCIIVPLLPCLNKNEKFFLTFGRSFLFHIWLYCLCHTERLKSSRDGHIAYFTVLDIYLSLYLFMHVTVMFHMCRDKLQQEVSQLKEQVEVLESRLVVGEEEGEGSQ